MLLGLPFAFAWAPTLEELPLLLESCGARLSDSLSELLLNSDTDFMVSSPVPPALQSDTSMVRRLITQQIIICLMGFREGKLFNHEVHLLLQVLLMTSNPAGGNSHLQISSESPFCRSEGEGGRWPLPGRLGTLCSLSFMLDTAWLLLNSISDSSRSSTRATAGSSVEMAGALTLSECLQGHALMHTSSSCIDDVVKTNIRN